MKEIISGEQSKIIDNISINRIGIPSLVLMERAACSVVDEINKLVNNDRSEKVLIICGTGNNGADGLAIARILDQQDINVEVCIAGNINKATEQFKVQMEILNNIGFRSISYWDSEDEQSRLKIVNADIIVDAIFGIGLSRNIEGDLYTLIDTINIANAKRIAVDVPSGICADTGRVYGIAIQADFTVTFGKMKQGLILHKGKDFTGDVIVRDIGFPKASYNIYREEYNENFALLYEDSDMSLIPRRRKNSNKGTFGRVGVIGGNENMSGAVYFSAKAACKTGAGLVNVFTCEENINILKIMLPEAIYDSYNNIEEYLLQCSCFIIGPGLGVNSRTSDLIKMILLTRKPVVIDADAINTISKQKDILEMFHKNVVITPHLKEMSRLIDEDVKYIAENIMKVAENFAKKYGCICVLKDSTTVVASDKIFINTTGNSGMATGGSGDVLSGIIGGLISQNMDISSAAGMGVYIHGLAGDCAARINGEYSMTASDIIDSLHEVFIKGCNL